MTPTGAIFGAFRRSWRVSRFSSPGALRAPDRHGGRHRSASRAARFRGGEWSGSGAGEWFGSGAASGPVSGPASGPVPGPAIGPVPGSGGPVAGVGWACSVREVGLFSRVEAALTVRRGGLASRVGWAAPCGGAGSFRASRWGRSARRAVSSPGISASRTGAVGGRAPRGGERRSAGRAVTFRRGLPPRPGALSSHRRHAGGAPGRPAAWCTPAASLRGPRGLRPLFAVFGG